MPQDTNPRYEIQTFAQCMEHKLQKNDHKGGWEDVSNTELFRLLRLEVDELEEAMANEPTLNSVFEAADIANFAMMIGWNALRQLVTPEGGNYEQNHEIARAEGGEKALNVCAKCGQNDCKKEGYCDGVPF